MVTQVGYSVVERSRSQVALCAFCTMHVETRSAGFLVEPQNQGLRFVSSLASKPLGRFPGLASNPMVTVSPSLASKPMVTVFFWLGLKTGDDGFLGLASKSRVTVSQFGSQNWQLRFGDLGIKITVMVSWFGR
jgi:hypothetical protein